MRFFARFFTRTCRECARLERIVLDQQARLARLERENDQLIVEYVKRGETNKSLNRRLQKTQAELNRAEAKVNEFAQQRWRNIQ